MGLFDSFTSGIVSGIISPITNTITAIFTKQEDVSLEKYKVDGQVNVALIQADTARIQAQQNLNQTLSSYTLDRWMRYGMVVPVIVWFATYMYDSTFRELLPGWATWRVLTPEPQIMAYITAIFGFYFLHSWATSKK